MPFFEKLSLLINKLSEREKLFLLVGVPFTAVILVYFLLIEPVRERAALLSRLVPQKKAEIVTLNNLSEEYQTLSVQMKEIEGRLPGKDQFAPLSYLEEIAKQNQVRGNIASIRSIPPITQAPYREIPMEVKMENITLMQIIPFLNTIETSPYFLRIKRLNMKAHVSEPQKLDVTFVVSSYEKI